MENQSDDEKSQEFHFGEWTSNSENDSQGGYDSDTICPISLNDLISIGKKSQKQNQFDETDFVIPSLADAANKNKNQNSDNNELNKENTFNSSVSKILYDFSQDATVLGFDSSLSNQSNFDEDVKDDKIEFTSQKVNKNINTEINSDDEKLKSFTSLVKNEQTFVQLHQKYFSSSSDSDILVVTNNEEVLEPDSDSSTENAFEDYKISQIKQTKSQIYDINDKGKGNKTLLSANIPKNRINKSQIQQNQIKLSKSESKMQNPSTKQTQKNKQSEYESESATNSTIQDESTENRKSLIQSKKLLNSTAKKESIILSTRKSMNKMLSSSSQKHVTLVLSSSSNSSSSSSSSINFDADDAKGRSQSSSKKAIVPLASRSRHLNTLTGSELVDSSYSYSSDAEENQLSQNSSDSLDSSLSPKKATKQNQTQRQVSSLAGTLNRYQQRKQSQTGSLVRSQSKTKSQLNDQTSTLGKSQSKTQSQSVSQTSDLDKSQNKTQNQSISQTSDLDKSQNKTQNQSISQKSALNKSLQKSQNQSISQTSTLYKSQNKTQSQLSDQTSDLDKSLQKSQNQSISQTSTLYKSQTKSQLSDQTSTLEKSLTAQSESISQSSTLNKSQNKRQSESIIQTSTSIKSLQKSHNQSSNQTRTLDESQITQSESISQSSTLNKPQQNEQTRPETANHSKHLNDSFNVTSSDDNKESSLLSEASSSLASLSASNPSIVNSPIGAINLQMDYDGTIKYPTPKPKKQSERHSSSPVPYPVIPKLVLSDNGNRFSQLMNGDSSNESSAAQKESQSASKSPFQVEIEEEEEEVESENENKSELKKSNRIENEKQSQKEAGIEKADQNMIEIEEEEEIESESGQPSITESTESINIESESHKSFNVSMSDGSFIQNAKSELRKSRRDKNAKVSASTNEGVVKLGSFEKRRRRRKNNSEDSEGSKSDNDDSKWVDDDPSSPPQFSTSEELSASKSSQKGQRKAKSQRKSQNLKESIEKVEKPPINRSKNESFIDMEKAMSIRVFSFYYFISQPQFFNEYSQKVPNIMFTSLVLTINSVMNLPPPAGVSQLDLIVHFQNLRCSPIIVNLKSARFRSGKYDASDSQLLIRIPLSSPKNYPQSFFYNNNSEELNCLNSNCLVLSFELIGNGKRLCGSNLVLLNESDGRLDIADLGKHFLRLMLKPDMKCELKKGEKEPLIEVQINKVADRDELQMNFLPAFSIIHVFFVDSVIAYRQILEKYRSSQNDDFLNLQSNNDRKIYNTDFEMLSFFSSATSDLQSMKYFAKSFKEAMKKMPKDKRSDDDKLKLFVDILRGSVIQGLTKAKNNPKAMLPFNTRQITNLNS